ncbi:MAG TPA: IPT/TIG domain-containing protein [Acidimicrobiales bacterium]|nr:IPT/TIG domain-containing protein [Acidimicrobiales bacterium]
MFRGGRTSVVCAAIGLLGPVAAVSSTASASTASASTTTLVVPQGTAFSYLGHSCGGIQEQVFATGFDPTSGYPTGDAYLQTRCGGSGRGGGYHTTTYSAWVGVTWDFTGAVVTSSSLTTPPATDPTFSAVDANGNQLSNSSNSAFLTLGPTFVPAPRVTTISTDQGPAVGGTGLTITGTGFTAATAVSFGTTPAASFSVTGDTSITAVSPAAGAGTVDVTVTGDGGQSATAAFDEFTFVAAPAVSGLGPTSGPTGGGTAVTITGTNFTDASAVYLGGTPVGFVVNDDTSITVVTPPAEGGPDTQAVTVASIGGTSAPSGADQFTYTASGPTVSLSAPSGPAGTVVDIKAAAKAPVTRATTLFTLT